MDKEREIEEMEEVALRSGHSNGGYIEFDYRDIAECFYEAGYRKADEVRKETIEEISNFLRGMADIFEMNTMLVDWLVDKIERKLGEEEDE